MLQRLLSKMMIQAPNRYLRREAHILQWSNGVIPDNTLFKSSFRSGRGLSSCTWKPFESDPEWKLVVSQMGDHSISRARMCHRSSNHVSTKGKYLQLLDLDKEEVSIQFHEQLIHERELSCSQYIASATILPNRHRSSCAYGWLDEANKIKSRRQEELGHTHNSETSWRIPQKIALLDNSQIQVENFQNGSTFENSKSCLCSSKGNGDQMSLKMQHYQDGSNGQKEIFSGNHTYSPAADSDSVATSYSFLTSSVLGCRVKIDANKQNINYLRHNHERETGLLSTRKFPQSSVSVLEKPVDKENEVDRAVAANGKYFRDGEHTLIVNGESERNIKKILDGKKNDVFLPDLRKRLISISSKVLIVDCISAANKAVRLLTNKYRHLIHACDTEVAKINVKQETPVDHGQVTCFSIYSGPGADFGNGKSCIWVDVLDGGRDLLVVFAPFFEDPSIRKVWHNYSFDNHVIENYGIKLSGFHADTMHMARLWDSSRRIEGGYSLEALTGDKIVMSGASLWPEEKLIGKVSMKTIFGRKKVKKDGSEGKITIIPPVENLQRETREAWICYSALDSMSTLKLYESLKCKLKEKKWILNGEYKGTMLNFYEMYWRPFGELLVKMETEGMLVDRAHLAEIEKTAMKETQMAADRFRNWASKYCPDARYMNIGSDAQLRQLFFGGAINRKDPDAILPKTKVFKVPNIDKVIEEGKKAPTKYRNINLFYLDVKIKTEMYTASGWPSVSGDALKTLAGKVSADFDFVDSDLESLTEGDVDDNEETMAKEVSGTLGPTNNDNSDISSYGTAYDAFGGGKTGREACHAIAALCEVCSIDSLISNFILPLQGKHISGRSGRIHCSLNINTETGRLSARRPNLQNQPALEKDRYKIRQAFIAAPGNFLLVADYGQLELRILAHLAKCKTMLDAFKAGGDFHSRTAMNMYPHIQEAVEQKRVLLEWHPEPGKDKPPAPLLKDAFASERRKAKMLNFSIAYGKTPVGLARDWKVPVKEAKETVGRWYKGREEVLQWQEQRREEAQTTGCVHTLLGRARRFPSYDRVTASQRAHIERAAINTPVQGSAADVAMCAMLEISRNVCLKELGWRLLLQVHDEVILEGPTESAEIAKAIVADCMSKPFDGKNILEVDLAVDAKFAQNWYSAK